MKETLKKHSTLLALVALAIFFTIATDGIFISPRNLTNLARQVSINGILAIGMTFVILIAGIDLSLGSVVALSGIIVGISQVYWGLSQWGIAGTLISCLLAILTGVLCGLFNSYWIAKKNITSFITTLGMMVIARGLALIFSDGVAIAPMSTQFQEIGNGYIPPYTSLILMGGLLGVMLFPRKQQSIFNDIAGQISIRTLFTITSILLLSYVFFNYKGIPLPVLFLALIAGAGSFVLNRMTIGRYIYAIGGNAQASHLSGVPIQKVTFFVFALMGALSGLSGAILTSRLNGAMPTAGNLFELDAIAAVVIGGTSLMGGIGTITGSILGAFMIGTLNNGMSLMNIPTFYQMVIKGVIIILAVYFDANSKQQQHS